VGEQDRARPGPDHDRDPARGWIFGAHRSSDPVRFPDTADLRDAGRVPEPAIEDRALEVQVSLAGKGKHRAPSIPDLIIAVTAELAGLTVLHMDKGFDLTADLTGQIVERLHT